jgi:hypothetical protein
MTVFHQLSHTFNTQWLVEWTVFIASIELKTTLIATVSVFSIELFAPQKAISPHLKQFLNSVQL